MPVTININDLSLCHRASGGFSAATIPDVCKTPAPPAPPVPIPYPNIATEQDLAKGTTTVSADGGNMCAIFGSEFFKSTGDEPGVVGGILSSTFIKEATWITYSFDVKLEGKGACRLTDKMFHNHQNTINAAGKVHAPVTASELEAKLLKCPEAQAVYDKAKAANGGKDPKIETGTVPGGFGGHTELGKGKILINDKNDGCQQVQTLCFELGNLSRKSEFEVATKKISGSREEFIKGYENIEYENVKDTQKIVEKCMKKWGCEGVKSRYEWAKSAKDFDDYYKNYLRNDHKEAYGTFWDSANPGKGPMGAKPAGSLTGKRPAS